MKLQRLVAELSKAVAQVEEPMTEARLLAAGLFGGDMAKLYRQYPAEVSPEDESRLRLAAGRRAGGEPLQHILGEAWFFGRRFLCDHRALVPRPETETLISAFLSEALPKNPRILDVGTGSGVIGITLALEIAGSAVTGTENYPPAASLARENAALHQALNFTIAETDMVSGLFGTFHGVAANLPYIPTKDIPGLAREVSFDPVSALDGGPTGLECVERLLRCVGPVTAPGGLLVLETGFDQTDRVCFLLSGWRDVRVVPDLAGRPRVVTARRAA
jgi:release factor glutamine methyltransferase